MWEDDDLDFENKGEKLSKKDRKNAIIKMNHFK